MKILNKILRLIIFKEYFLELFYKLCLIYNNNIPCLRFITSLNPNTMEANRSSVWHRKSAKFFQVNWLQHHQVGAGLV